MHVIFKQSLFFFILNGNVLQIPAPVRCDLGVTFVIRKSINLMGSVKYLDAREGKCMQKQENIHS